MTKYRFEISMAENGMFHCYVWERDEIVHSIHKVKTEKEAEAWIEERAAFLGKTNYTINKKLVR